MITDTTLRGAPGGTAWKTSSMRGYLFKTALDSETYGAGAYTLTFRKAADDNGAPVDYVFYFNVDAEASAEAAAAESADGLVLDAELLGHILKATWLSGAAADFEAVRSGTGDW